MPGTPRLPETIHTIPQALAFWAERTPDAPAVRSIDGQARSHRELRDVVTRVATRLHACGIQGDDRVALVLPGGADACVALLGVMSAAVAVPFNPAATAPELTRDLERLRPQLLVTSDTAGETSHQVARELGMATIALSELLAVDAMQSLPYADPPRITPDSIAAILHTSGTTGFPKRVPRPHRTFVAGARAARQCTDLTPADVALLTAGLSTNSGLVNICAALLNGGSCVVAPRFDPVDYPAWLERHRPTWTVSTATELNMLLDAAAAAGRDCAAGPGSRLRAVRVGAQPMTPGTLERAERSLRALIFDGYGMSEASYITGSGPGPQDRREGSCARGVWTEIRILDQRNRDAPPGMSGEIVIRGPTLFAGYLDDPEANAAAFLPGGWFRTGDLGYLDEDGYLFLHGRLNELINRGGEKIAPLEVDHALMRHPAVAEAAVFAVPDARLGEDVVAAVVLRPGLTATPRELRSWMLDRLSPYKVPRRIWMVERLPRTATGKVQRGVLADQFVDVARRRAQSLK